MRVHVLVLCDLLDGLARTSGSLDLQAMRPSEFAVSYLVSDLGAEASLRLDDLVSKRPNVEAVTVQGGDWRAAVRQVAAESRAESLLVLTAGDHLYPQALDRLTAAAEQGDDLVVARRVGQATWGAEESRGPIAAALVSRSLAAGAEPSSSAGSIASWLTGWHDALLAAATSLTVLEDYPVLAASTAGATGALPDVVTVQESSATWDGVALALEATVATSSPEVQHRFAVRGPDGIEFALPTQVDPTGTTGSATRLRGRLDVATAALGQPLGAGDWAVGVVAEGPGNSAWMPLPRARVRAGIVGGRPVVPTLQTDDLVLQVGRVRRRYFQADPAEAVITESVSGVELLLPISGPHVAGTDVLAGSLFLGGLKVPAVLRTDAEGTHLQSWLSGLAGRYRMSVMFGHAKPVSLGTTLVVDGVGAMSMEPTQAPVPAAAGESRSTALSRVRSALPKPVVDGLSRMPALRRWYGERVG